MSSQALANWAIAAALLAVGIALVRRARRADRLEDQPYMNALYDEARQEWVNTEAHPVGPDSLRLLKDLEAHMKAYGAAVADYYDTTPGGPQ